MCLVWVLSCSKHLLCALPQPRTSLSTSDCVPWLALRHSEHLLCALCQAGISKCRPGLLGWNLTPCVSLAPRETRDDPCLEMARAIGTPGNSPTSQWPQRGEEEGIKGEGGSREQQASLPPAWAQGLVVHVHAWLCAHHAFVDWRVGLCGMH